MIRKLMAVAMVVGCGESIVSSGGEKPPATAVSTTTKKDNAPEESIKRGFSYGEDGHHLGAYGTSPSGGYGEGYDHYGDGHEAAKYYGYEDHYKPEHKPDPAYYKALAIKGLLIPLAGVALLGAAAAFVSNPILLQLGVISSTYGRRRRRSAADGDGDASRKYRELQLLERFMAQVPREEMRSQEERLLAEYLACSGASSGEESCVERLACELHTSPTGTSMPIERSVMAVIANEILANKFVPDGLKSRVARAVQRGRSDAGCHVYRCARLAAPAESAGNGVSAGPS